jgi:urea-proton symporter
MLIVFGMIIILATFLLTRKQRSNIDSFHAANRSVGLIQGALTIAVTWTWAPAVLVSAQKGYQQGIVGAFWFIAPNILALIVFAFFAMRFRGKAPDGYTLSNYMLSRYSKRVHNVYKYLMLALNPMCFAIQLLAGGKVMSFILGIDYTLGALLVASIVLIYTLLRGLQSTILADIIQVLLLIILILVILPFSIIKFGQLGISLSDGLGGFSGVYDNLFNSDGLMVFLSYGLVQTIGLMAGPWGDQIYWHRVYAVEKKQVKNAFILGAILFAIIPISMAILGLMGAGGEIHNLWQINDVSIVNVEVIDSLLPGWALSAFALVLLCALATTMSSALSSFSTLIYVDFFNKELANNPQDKEMNLISRASMVILAIIGVAVALVPGISLLYFFLFYTVVRASTLIPTAYTIVSENRDDRGIFYGVLCALVIGTPIYGYGSITGQNIFNLIGALSTVLIPGLFILIFSIVRRSRLAEGVVVENY